MSYKATAANFRQQVEDQKGQVENLKSALLKLQTKLAEAQSKSDVLIAQHRRARAMNKATEATSNLGDNANSEAFDRMKSKVRRHEATAQAHAELVGDVGPSLGLLGTLIPMGSSLASLASGNLEAMAGQMVVAFTTTIVGLAVGTLAYLVAAVRQAWITEAVREQRYVAERIAVELAQGAN